MVQTDKTVQLVGVGIGVGLVVQTDKTVQLIGIGVG